MAITISGLQALTVKGIDTKGGVKDAVFKNDPYLKRLKEKQGVYNGEKHTSPFNYMDSTQTTGSYYQGAESLSSSMVPYDPITSLEWNLVEIQETLVISHADLAKNSGDAGKLKLLEQRLKLMEKAMRERITKGIYSDGTIATGALTAKQFIGMLAFLKNTAVNYGGISSADVSVHVAYVNKNAGTPRALTTALHQKVKGGCSEGSDVPTVGLMRQNVMDEFIELIVPHQRTVKENTLNGMGHTGEILHYSGLDHFVDNLSIAASITMLNEEYVKMFVHPDYDMKRTQVDNLDDQDAMMQRLFLKGVYACNVLRRQGLLGDLIVQA